MYALHEVTGASLPDDARRVCPLVGNDQIKLVLDARGAMHDFTPAQGSYPPPRIVWAGRRHNLRIDRYSSNLFEWGFLDLRLDGDETLPPVTGWRQRLHPREGYVETVIERGEIVERTITFVHLEKNLLVIHREYYGLPLASAWHARAVYTFCHVGTEAIPFRTTWQPGDPTANGITAATTADGTVLYHGQVALFSDGSCAAQVVENRLELTIPLIRQNAVTVYLSLQDDLGNDPQLLPIPDGAWMSPPVREVNCENLAREIVHPDPVAATNTLRAWVSAQGFTGVFADQQEAWRRFWDEIHLELPSEETTLRAALETQLYTLRCSFTDYSLPANPFNTSWGACYFWDERYGLEGLLACGALEMPRRILEWRRRILPFSTMMTAGRGARYVASAVEPGSMTSDRNGTHFYEFPLIGVIVNYLWQYCRYQDDPAVLRRYYPIVCECAEFFRQWMLVELPGQTAMLVPSIDIDEGHYPVQDGPAMVCGAARTLRLAWEMSETLGIDDPAGAEWRRMGEMALGLARSLFVNELAKTGQTLPGYYCEMELQDLPATTITPDPAILAWREQYRIAHAPELPPENVTGEAGMLPLWSWGFLGHAYVLACCGQADEALTALRGSLQTMMDFGALNESATSDLSIVHHPWFTTGAGAYLRAVTRMLLYPKDDHIVLLPGIPRAWRDLRFTLPAHHGILVTLEVADGQVTELTLRATQLREHELIVHLPARFPLAPMNLSPTAQIECIADETILRFPPTAFDGQRLSVEKAGIEQ